MNRFSKQKSSIPHRRNIKADFSIGLMVLGMVLVGYEIKISYAGAWLRAQQYKNSVLQTSSQSYTSQPQEQLSALAQTAEKEQLVYPTDRLFITSEREAYQDGEMVLRIPCLALDVSVMDGTDEQTLKKGVGLYEYAQTPGEENCNVSIAGHRDIYGCEFYNLDKVTDGDYLYLEYNGMLYTYQYMQTEIVEADDWNPIYCKDFSCLTLTSCHPIGTSQKRIVVTAELISNKAL